MALNPLIAIPSPRTIPEIIKAFEKITEYDKLWIKDMKEYQAYPLMRDKFLNHPSEHYTHLIICPDDLLIDDKNKLKMLLEHYEQSLTHTEREKTIISGYCNVDKSGNINNANVTKDDVSPHRQDREYHWITLETLDHIRKEQEKYIENKRYPPDYKKFFLFSVKFAGFPLFIIPRKIVERIPFRNDSPTGQFDECGCCVDVMFCHDAIRLGYKIYVDVRVYLNHLKINDILTNQLIRATHQIHKDPHFFMEYACMHAEKKEKEKEKVLVK